MTVERDAMTDLTRIKARAAHIEELVAEVVAERKLLRADLTAANHTGQWGKEDLVAAAAGGLSRALVLEHLGDVSGKVRKAVKRNGLIATVAVRADGEVVVSDVELAEPAVDRLRLDEDDEDKKKRAEVADRTALRNSIGALIAELLKQHSVFVPGGREDRVWTVATGGVLRITRQDS